MKRAGKHELEFNRLIGTLSLTLRSFTEEENIQINEELNLGMEKFLSEQRVREKASEMELAGIILNG
jgi:hypothetical protein